MLEAVGTFRLRRRYVHAFAVVILLGLIATQPTEARGHHLTNARLKPCPSVGSINALFGYHMSPHAYSDLKRDLVLACEFREIRRTTGRMLTLTMGTDRGYFKRGQFEYDRKTMRDSVTPPYDGYSQGSSSYVVLHVGAQQGGGVEFAGLAEAKGRRRHCLVGLSGREDGQPKAWTRAHRAETLLALRRLVELVCHG
jgi:hypothetical protein